MNAKIISSTLLVIAVLGVARAADAVPLGTGFTYQGQLQQNGSPTSGACDFRFSLFDAPGSGSPPTGGNQVGVNQSLSGVSVTDGLFTVSLNGAAEFGATAFAGEDRWLQIGVSCPTSGSPSYTTLSPRQRLTAAPYALYAPTAGSAGDLTCTSCVGSTDLAPGAVTANKIANGTIQTTNLAFTPGTVMSVTAGTGLTGGTITTSGTIAANIGTAAGTVAAGNHNHGGQSWTTSSPGGLQVESTATDGNGLLGTANTGAGSHGVKGISAQGLGVFGIGAIGVTGDSEAKTGIGVHGRSTGSNGIGVLGVSEHTGADGTGVIGESTGGGNGVRGRSMSGTAVDARTDTGIGVFGDSNSGPGVYGSSMTATGVVAASDSGAGLTTVSGTGVALVATGGSGNLIEAYKNGRPSVRKFYVSNAGEVFAAGAYHANGADVAEVVPTSDHPEAGDVVEIDPLHPGQFRRAATANSTVVAGVISTQPGVALREKGAADGLDDAPQLALVGRVPVKVSAEHGAIRPGDLLVAGATPGRAMRAPENPAVGSVVGKALGALESGNGTIQMLVMLR